MKKNVMVAAAVFAVLQLASCARSDSDMVWEGNWQVLKEIDIMDDTEDIIIGINSNDDKYALFGFGCYNNNSLTMVSFLPHPPFLYSFLDDSAKVVYRIDKNQPIDSTWTISIDKTFVNLYENTATSFLKEIYNANSLIFRTYGVNSVSTNTFNLTGIKPQVDKIAEHCNWE